MRIDLSKVIDPQVLGMGGLEPTLCRFGPARPVHLWIPLLFFYAYDPLRIRTRWTILNRARYSTRSHGYHAHAHRFESFTVEN